MPVLDKFPGLTGLTDFHTWYRNKECYHFLCEIIVDMLLGEGPCLRPLPALSPLRNKGYIPHIENIPFAHITEQAAAGSSLQHSR